MKKILSILAFAAAMVQASGAAASAPSPHAIEIPKWFSETFLDFGEDVRDAAREGKRVMVYFGQDGCPYCKALMTVNFRDPAIVETMRRHFVAIALNLWGDREVKWIDGRAMSEKKLGERLKVQATPTLLFLDEKGEVVLRLNGWHPPERFKVALDYARLPKEGRPDYTDYVARRSGGPAAAQEEDLSGALARGKPVLAFVTRAGCKECEEIERDGLKRPEVAKRLAAFTVVRRDAGGSWARSANITYAPSLVFFDPSGKEAFRLEGYVRAFHIAAAIDYVASGSWRTEPSFQRYLQARADTMRARGETVDLMK